MIKQKMQKIQMVITAFLSYLVCVFQEITHTNTHTHTIICTFETHAQHYNPVHNYFKTRWVYNDVKVIHCET